MEKCLICCKKCLLWIDNESMYICPHCQKIYCEFCYMELDLCPCCYEYTCDNCLHETRKKMIDKIKKLDYNNKIS